MFTTGEPPGGLKVGLAVSTIGNFQNLNLGLYVIFILFFNRLNPPGVSGQLEQLLRVKHFALPDMPKRQRKLAH